MDASQRERGERLVKIKGLIDEDFLNYKKPSMYVAFPKCDFKCDRENGCRLCQNSSLAKSPDIEISAEEIAGRYMSNPITEAIVCCGLEPMDTFEDLLDLLREFRKKTEDDFVIYTGYDKEEIKEKIEALRAYPNVIVKFGRFRPDKKKHTDDILGVKLIGEQQYAERIS
jgi:organic radical activating enzyme